VKWIAQATEVWQEVSQREIEFEESQQAAATGFELGSVLIRQASRSLNSARNTAARVRFCEFESANEIRPELFKE